MAAARSKEVFEIKRKLSDLAPADLFLSRGTALVKREST
jgi:hypothetical protein